MKRNVFIIIIIIAVAIVIGIFTAPKQKQTSSSNISKMDVVEKLAVKNITVRVVLHPVRVSSSISTSRSDNNIKQLFLKTQKIWNQADITFVFDIQEITVTDNIASQLEQYNFQTLYQTFDVNQDIIHIFFLRRIGSNGIAVGPKLAVIADITSVNDFRATAHEIGHLLGLKHTAESVNRLMFQGVNGTDLTEDEIFSARKMANNFVQY